jgi:uncharacterized membrane protein
VFCGVCVAHLFSFLCCVFGGAVLLIVLVFCVVFLVGLCCSSFGFLCCVFGGVCVAHLFSFLCCVFGGAVLLIFLVFCVVFLKQKDEQHRPTKNTTQKTKTMSNTAPPKTQHRKLKR